MKILVLVVTLSQLTLVSGCGGGGSSDSPAPLSPSPAPDPVPQTLRLQDSLPRNNVMTADPMIEDISVAHLGYSDLSVAYSGACTTGIAIRRSLVDLSDQAFAELFDHKLRCTNLQANQTHTVVIESQRTSGAQFETELTFSTSISSTPDINILDSVMSPRAAIETMFADNVRSSLLPKLSLPAAIEALILTIAVDLFSSWTNLSQPDAIYGVTTQRVNYASRDPDGNASIALTGLVAMPETSGAFTVRDRVIVLTHSTGSTPGDLESTNAWYFLANLLAGRGYLVIAADNWGRGGTSADPETYLLANRTAANSLDLVQRVLADSDYDAFRSPNDPTELTIIGYSQGGHSAIALWQAFVTHGPVDVVVREVFAGGAPYNLYETFRGVVQHLDGSCGGGAYCRYVDTETTVPFVSRRILPGFLEYTNTGLTMASVTEGDSVSGTFVSGFLADSAEFDSLKILLQQSSFTNVSNPAESYNGSSASLRLYHSDFDRLVPEANTRELVTLLWPHQSVEYRSDICNGLEYEIIFNSTDFVGIVHSLCGLSMMNDVMAELR